MTELPTALLSWAPFLAPALIGLYGLACFTQPGRRPALAGAAPAVGLAALGLAATGLAAAAVNGATSVSLGGAIAFRIDLVSATLLALIGFIGAVVLRFTRTYLDGEARQGAFHGFMALTLASVMLLVTAGDLVVLAAAWIATSLFLHQLLLFYPERPGAQRAARKRFFTARLSDASLLLGLWLLWSQHGTTDIATILADADSGDAWAAGFLALAAVLKSAQFPTHGWLTEVMETPTPVSALLHAGVINAGGFLLIRFADVMLTAPAVMAMLVIIGGFTALFGGLVMLTQPAVKTSLAWSTVGQMGFMVLQCGLGLFALALLHIVAHSLYKAHAFLSSGGAVDRVAAIRRPGPVAIPKLGAVTRAFVVALGIYLGMSAATGWLFGFDSKSPQAVALGAILIFGIAYLFAQGFADAAPKALTRSMALYALLASGAYFALQTASEALFAGMLPATPAPGPLEWALLVLAIVSFGVVAIAQATFPLWAYHPAAAGLRVHLANGLYVNALTDRFLNAWARRGSA